MRLGLLYNAITEHLNPKLRPQVNFRHSLRPLVPLLLVELHVVNLLKSLQVLHQAAYHSLCLV